MICGKYTCSLEPGEDHAEMVITRLETDNGLVGYGESGAVGAYPAYAASILAGSAELIERHLMHKDPRHIAVIQHTMDMIAGQGPIKTGFDKSSETDIHRDAITELDDSFSAEARPLVVEVDGEIHELTGSAEVQYAKWRALLKRIYASETGLPGS